MLFDKSQIILYLRKLPKCLKLYLGQMNWINAIYLGQPMKLDETKQSPPLTDGSESREGNGGNLNRESVSTQSPHVCM